MINKYLVVMALGCLCAVALADVDTTTEAERRYLIKVAQDIKHLELLTNKAEQQADPDARVTVDYVSLKNDLAEIRRALEAHINQPSRSPRVVQPLQFRAPGYADE